MKTIIFSFVSSAAFLIPAMVSAAPTTFFFSGTVAQVPIDDLYGDIGFGSAFQGRYTFDSEAADLIPADSSSGSYTSSGIPFELFVTIEGHSFTASNSVNVGIFNSFIDQYTVLGLGAGDDLTLELFLQDNSGAAFANDGLPLTPPLLSAFTLQTFHLHQITGGGELQVDGQVTNLSTVPEPSAGLFVCSGLAVLLMIRFCKQRRMAMLRYLLVLVGLISKVYAVDGLILIDQNRALAGNVTPGDAPGFPVSITQKGSYKLSGNLTVPNGNTTAIEINSDSVTVDLNGFSILGPVDCTAGFPCSNASTSYDTAAGIKAGGLTGTHHFNLTVRNGTIQGMGGSGIFLIGDSIQVEDMHVRSNGWNGIYLSRNAIWGPNAQYGTTVRHNNVHLNGNSGISIQGGLVIDNVVSLNSKYGIAVALEGAVSRNHSSNNGSYGLLASPYVGYSGNALTSNSGGQVPSGQVTGGVNLGQNLCGVVVCP